MTFDSGLVSMARGLDCISHEGVISGSVSALQITKVGGCLVSFGRCLWGLQLVPLREFLSPHSAFALVSQSKSCSNRSSKSASGSSSASSPAIGWIFDDSALAPLSSANDSFSRLILSAILLVLVKSSGVVVFEECSRIDVLDGDINAISIFIFLPLPSRTGIFMTTQVTIRKPIPKMSVFS